MDDYFFQTEEKTQDDKVFVLIIYDIINDRQRVKFAKYLQGYGFRIQKSAFEAMIPRKKYEKLIRGISQYVTKDDSVRVYKIIGKGQVTSFGKDVSIQEENIILI
jgi:CRISPR-associated protein Cas2